MPLTDEELGRIAYEAACKAANDEDPRRFHSQKSWDDDAILRRCWIAAARAVKNQISREVDKHDFLEAADLKTERGL